MEQFSMFFGVHGLMYAALESYFFSSAYTGHSTIKLTTTYSTQ